MEQGAVFPLFYLPPIAYFNKIIQHKQNIIFECHEHFPKQTYRNRAAIHSPNGKLDLIVPVTRGSKQHTSMKDVKISYDFDWQRLHWQTLQTSYRRSAYFEYYEDHFVAFYEKKWDFLLDYNEQIFGLLLQLLRLNIPYSFTEAYEKTYPELEDYRSSIHPKMESGLTHKPYFQLFEDRNGFLPNLSIVDLLFNQGPQSLSFL